MAYLVTYTYRDDGLERQDCVAVNTRIEAETLAAAIGAAGGWDIEIRAQPGEASRVPTGRVVQ